MFIRILLAVAVIGCLGVTIAKANGVNCLPRVVLEERLMSIGETQQGAGVRDEKAVIEVWACETTTTWTILLSFVGGMSCIVSFGHGWSSAAIPAGEAL